ncbi:uncharacterized protein TM35_000052320 [Trypanosoma theileri]|uniref:Uncharacterized protein n=1 Tax=Trypanosoma theileri TaxID=67003 RepID=A0A1X0P3Y8_9TRYP|nr:uncharacterized protein TM35_000052320 [Trypanosoma theileri]ORC91636.1 hypothetical protein TM35_000052320 [Trypanosoma theileri]
MKFWVKAITDDNVQEQLLVNASNSNELARELSALLHTHVTRMSVTDFQSQVLDKISSGADIITVKIFTAKTTGQPSEMDGSFTQFDVRTQRGTPAQSDIFQMSYRDEEDWIGSSRSPSITDSVPRVRPSISCRLTLDVPSIDRICLWRDDIELLLNESHGGAYHDVVRGCFARIREKHNYNLYQIVKPVNNVELLLDFIYYEEIRRTEVVSNAVPVQQEINAWGKKMITASRPFVTIGFIAAKVGDIDSAIRSAKAATEEISIQTLAAAPPPTPPANRIGKYGRRGRNTIISQPRVFSYVSQGPILLKTNDTLLHAQLSVVEEPEKSDFEFVLFATRHANSTKKKPRLSDFSGCMITLPKEHFSGVVKDRDVTEKGYEIFCSPQRWDCHYVSLGQIRPSVDDTPYYDDANNLQQDFTLLSGRFMTGLFDTPIVITLPIPLWAQVEGYSAYILRPHLVVHKDKLHVFYLIRTSEVHSSPRSSVSHGNMIDANNSLLCNAGSPGNTSTENKVLPPEGSKASPGCNSHNGSFHSAPITDIYHYGLAHAVSCDPKMRTWQIISEKTPLLSCSCTIPVFTVASTSPCDAMRDVSINVGAGVSSSASSSEKVLQILWYEEESPLQRSNISLRPSPCSIMSLSTSLSNRVALPFERWVNSHEDTLSDAWVREPSFSTVRIDADSAKSGVASLSLCEHDGVVMAAWVQMDTHSRSTLTVVPLTSEP